MSIFNTLQINHPYGPWERNLNTGLNAFGIIPLAGNVSGSIRIIYGVLKCALSAIQNVSAFFSNQDASIAKDRLIDGMKQIAKGSVEIIPILGAFVSWRMLANEVSVAEQNITLLRDLAIEEAKAGNIKIALDTIEQIEQTSKRWDWLEGGTEDCRVENLIAIAKVLLAIVLFGPISHINEGTHQDKYPDLVSKLEEEKNCEKALITLKRLYVYYHTNYTE